jgi:hypothetical protein
MSQDAKDPISADDALRFMSDGGDLTQKDKAKAASADAQGQADDASTPSLEGGALGDSEAGHFTLPDEAADTAGMPAMDFAAAAPDSRTRYANANRMAQHAQTHQFKKIAIPLLLAVGALLLVMCITMGVMLLTGGMGHGDMTMYVVFVVAALFVSLILLAGAWYFHKEIHSHQQRQEQLAQYQQQGMQQPPQYQ